MGGADGKGKLGRGFSIGVAKSGRRDAASIEAAIVEQSMSGPLGREAARLQRRESRCIDA
jgi:hypothetical protein